MMNAIIRFIKFCWHHIFKAVFLLMAFLLFFFVLFPFGDLSDLISTQILNATNNSVYLQFKDLSINPATSTIHLDEVELDTPFIQELKMQRISASPSIFDLAFKKASGSITAEGLLGGQAQIELKSNSPYTESILNGTVSLNLDQISLEEVQKVMRSNVKMSGQLQVQSQMNIELENVSPASPTPNFALKSIEDGDVTIGVRKFKMPATMLNLPGWGPLGLPMIEINNVEFKGKIQQGKFTIETGKFGSPSEEVFGTIKGDMTMPNPIPPGTPLQMLFHSWDITLEITAKQSFKERALFLALLNEIEKDPSGLSRYKLHLHQTGMGLPPNR